MGNGATWCEWRHALEARGGFWEILKKSVSWVEDCLGRRRLTFACLRRPWAGVARDGGGADKKSRIERLCISLPDVETFNSKVIKGFVPELRNRYVFFVFQDSYVVCYIYVYFTSICYVHFTYSQIMAMVYIYISSWI